MCAHFELADAEGKPALHFVVHLPINGRNAKRQPFAKIYNVATGILDRDGRVHDTTLPAILPKRRAKAKSKTSQS